MGLLLAMINKKRELSDDFLVRKFYAKGIYNFYQCFLLATATLDLELNEDDMNERNKFYRRILLSGRKINERDFENIKNMMNQDMKIILEAINSLQEQDDDSNESMNDFGNHPDYVGVDAYEMGDMIE
jgi:hypothetical protein